MSKFEKFMKRFRGFYNDIPEIYLCMSISQFKRKHPLLSFWYRKEIMTLKIAIRGGLCFPNKSMTVLFYEDNPEIDKKKRINWLDNLVWQINRLY